MSAPKPTWKPDLCDVQELDPGIAEIVNKLRAHGVETYESCEGGDGHCFPEPTVRFFGGDGAQWQALGVAVMLAMPVAELRQVWSVSRGGVPTGPNWEMTFYLDGYVGQPYAEQIAATVEARNQDAAEFLAGEHVLVVSLERDSQDA